MLTHTVIRAGEAAKDPAAAKQGIAKEIAKVMS